MGWRGTLRSISAAANRMEREQQRLLRQLERETKQLSKLVELERRRLEVEIFNEDLAILTGMHRECEEAMDWPFTADRPEPSPPLGNCSAYEEFAQNKLNEYRPTFFQKLFGTDKKRLHELNQAVEVARQKDAAATALGWSQYQQNHKEWTDSTTLARAVLDGDITAYEDVLGDLDPFSAMKSHGCTLNHAFHSPHIVEAALLVDGDHVVPDEIKSLTSTGKLSVKKMPKNQFHEIYQDYVCGCALRVGREFMTVLPLEWVLVNAYAVMLNPATGHQETTPVLGVAMPRATLDSLNFEQIDPSDAMRNFKHRMGFKRGSGFTAVETIRLDEID